MTVKNTKNITKIEIWCNILTKRIVDINNIKLYNGLLPVVKIIAYETDHIVEAEEGYYFNSFQTLII